MGVSHIKTSPIADGTNTDLIRPSDWNSAHTYAISHSELADSLSGPHFRITLTGNTSGALAAISSGTLSLAGGNNITLSQAGNAVTISGAAAGGAQTGISGLANSETTYTSGTVSLSVVAGNLTIRSTTGQAFQFSASQTVQTQGITADELSIGVSTGGNTAGNTTVQTGQRMVLVGTGDISLSQATGAGSTTISISGSQSVQTQGITADELSIGASTGGNTAGNTTVQTGQRFVLVGTNGITLSQGTGAGSTTLTISGITQSVQTQGITADELSVGVSTGGNTAGNTTVQTGQRLVFVGTDNISLSQGTGAGSTTISIRDMHSTGTTVSSVGSANAVGANNSRYAQEAHVHEGVRRMGISTQGNTGGTTGFFPGSNIQLVGSNGITLSQSTDAASNNTITISGITQSVQTQGTVTMYANSNTTQSSTGTANISSINFAGAGIASVGVTNGSVVVSVPAGGGGGDGGVFAGVSTDGNTAGSTGTVSTGNFVLVGSQGISLSQSTGAAGSAATVTILGDPPNSMYNMNPIAHHMTTQIGNGSFYVMGMPLQNELSVSRLNMFAQFAISSSSNSSHAGTLSVMVGIYTRNVSTLSLSTSGSGTYAWTNTSNNSTQSLSGWRQITASISASLSAGDYWLAVGSRTSTANANWWTASNIIYSESNTAYSGPFGAATNASMHLYPGEGLWTGSSSVPPDSMAISAIQGSSTAQRLRPILNLVGFDI